MQSGVWHIVTILIACTFNYYWIRINSTKVKAKCPYHHNDNFKQTIWRNKAKMVYNNWTLWWYFWSSLSMLWLRYNLFHLQQISSKAESLLFFCSCCSSYLQWFCLLTASVITNVKSCKVNLVYFTNCNTAWGLLLLDELGPYENWAVFNTECFFTSASCFFL